MTLNALDVLSDDAGPTLPPPPSDGVRARRRRHRKQVRRRRRLRVLTVLATIAVVGALAFVVPKAARRVAAPPEPDAPVAAARTSRSRVVLAHRGADGNARWVTVLSPSYDERGGTIILMPPGTMTEVASLGLEPVGQSLALGGPTRLVSTMENLLGVDIRDAVVVDDAQLVAMHQAFGKLSIKVPTRVTEVDPSGAVEVLYEPGQVDVQPGEVPRMLTAKGRDSALTLLARHEAYWRSLLAAVQTRGVAGLAGSPLLQRSVGALARGEVDVRVLPVQAVGTSDDGVSREKTEELYQVRASEMPSFLAGAFPDEARRIVARPRVQVLNGIGGVEVAPRVADKLVPAGFQITLTGNADRFDYQQTQIVFYDRRKQATAERVRRALGTGRLVLSLNPLDVVDVTVIVGRDLPAK